MAAISYKAQVDEHTHGVEFISSGASESACRFNIPVLRLLESFEPFRCTGSLSVPSCIQKHESCIIYDSSVTVTSFLHARCTSFFCECRSLGILNLHRCIGRRRVLSCIHKHQSCIIHGSSVTAISFLHFCCTSCSGPVSFPGLLKLHRGCVRVLSCIHKHQSCIIHDS